MSGLNLVFNVAKGKIRSYAELSGVGDDLIAVLLKTTGLVSDAVMQDYLTLAAVLAGASDEVADGWYSRQPLTGVSVVQDDALERVDVDCADVGWTTTATGLSVAKLLVCYRPDAAGPSPDSAIVPLTMHNVGFTADGNPINFAVTGFARVTN